MPHPRRKRRNNNSPPGSGTSSVSRKRVPTPNSNLPPRATRLPAAAPAPQLVRETVQLAKDLAGGKIAPADQPEATSLLSEAWDLIKKYGPVVVKAVEFLPELIALL